MNKKVIFLIFIILILIIGILFLFKNSFKFQKETKQTIEQKTAVSKNNQQIENNQIIVFSPKPNEKIKSPLKITGQARGSWFFEASFPVVLTDWDGKIIAEHYATAKDNWMTENFVPFESILEFKNPVFTDAPENHFSRRGYLILKKDNPSGLPEYNDSIEIPVIFNFY